MLPAHIAAWALQKRKINDDNEGRESVDMLRRGNAIYQSGGGGWLAPSTGGGTNPIDAKGGGTPAMPKPMEEATATAWLEGERNRIAKENTAAADAKAAEEKRLLGENAANKQGSAFNTAKQYGTTQANARGFNSDLLNKYGVLDMFYGDLENQKAGMDPYDITPDFNTSTSFLDAVGTGQNTYRGDTTKAINALTGSGFEGQMIGDTMDDQILNTILGGQKTGAVQQIEAAHNRGQLNDQGYAKALADLDTAYTAGMGQAQTIGGGVLGNYRTNLTNLKNNALQQAGGLTLADIYDTNAYNTSIQDAVAKAGSSLQGDVTSAIGSQQFFDPTKLIATAGAGQGYYNPSNPAQTQQPTGMNPLSTALSEEQRRAVPNSTVF